MHNSGKYEVKNSRQLVSSKLLPRECLLIVQRSSETAVGFRWKASIFFIKLQSYANGFLHVRGIRGAQGYYRSVHNMSLQRR